MNEERNVNDSSEKFSDRANYVRPYLNGLNENPTYSQALRDNPSHISARSESRPVNKPVVMARYPVESPVASSTEEAMDFSTFIPKATAYVSYLSSPSASPLPLVTSRVMIHDDIRPLVEEVAKMIAALSYLIPKATENDQSVAKMLLS